MRPFLAASLMVLAGLGCARAQEAVPVPPPSSPPVADWPRPVRLPIAMPDASEPTELAFVAGKGLVKGSPEAIAAIGRPLEGADTASRTLDACKAAVWDRAGRAGGESIELAPQAADKRTRAGDTFAPVTMRLSYGEPLVTELRQSTVICVIDAAGRFVDAYVPAVSRE